MSDQEPLKTLADVERELAELDQQTADLQAEHAVILEQVAAATPGNSAELAQKFSLISARLQALPIIRAGLEKARQTVIKRQIIADYTALLEVIHQGNIEVDQIDEQIEKAQAILSVLAKRRSDKRDETDHQVRRKLMKLETIREVLSPDDFSALEKRYEYIPRRYRREQVVS